MNSIYLELASLQQPALPVSLAQMVYLRRACDRQWEAPPGQWEDATHLITDELAAMKKLYRENNS